MKRIWLSLLLVLASLAWAAPGAAESVASLAKKLLGDEDFRVRTQAALALGASGSSKAVSPLCKGLDDKSDTVRAAAAAGLGRLAKGGKDCLEARKKRESSRNVSKMIDKALVLLQEAASGPSLNGAKYYVNFGSVNVRGARKSEITSHAIASMRRALSRKSGFAFAPGGETKAQAKKRLRKYPSVAGYSLTTDVLVEYSGGDLTVEIQVTIYGYPEMDSQGSLSQFAGASANGEDADKENELLDQVIGKAMSKFAGMAASVD